MTVVRGMEKNRKMKEEHDSTQDNGFLSSKVSTTSKLDKRARNVSVNVVMNERSLKRMRPNRQSVFNDDSKSVTNTGKKRQTKTQGISIPSVSISPMGTDFFTTTSKCIQHKKIWLSQGLYVGQESDSYLQKQTTKNNKDSTKAEASGNTRPVNKLLPMPMFTGESLLEKGRDFKLPFDVFSPLPPGQPKPDKWSKKDSNSLVGEAATEWKWPKQLPSSRCICQVETECNKDCHNRCMLYECDESNCAFGSKDCTNRAFAELKRRKKSGKRYDFGVEVMKTAEKGFGLRACRTFQPNQVIVEYVGEIITKQECTRRIEEEYKDNECYYFMTFDQNMIIDAKRGSIARFVNHSCKPNCRMIKWKVAGKSRIALFAGDNVIMTGEELTYDYDLDSASLKSVQICKCGALSCRGTLGPRSSNK